ncbi:MAG TPA: hypothetical protein VFF28_00950 [Candidatus Nanoarchaeia archaeon]|nr:hypothetical protein [Candidatus Nanoarchaeia archaeon]
MTKLFYFIPLLLLLIGLALFLVPMQRGLPKGNGIVTNVWADSKRIETARQNGLKYLFVDVGDITKDGALVTPKEEIEEFLSLAKNKGFVLLPYTEVNTENYDFSSSRFMANLIGAHKELVDMGFDGAYLDVEAVQKDKEADYLRLVRLLRKELPSGSIIAAYAGFLKDSDNRWEWDHDFYQDVSESVDLIFVAGFDLDAKDASEYDEYIVSQMEDISSSGYKSYFMLGVPTHKKYPETIDSAMAAYRKALEGLPNDKFLGVAIFSDWTIDDGEWETYRRYR